MGRDSSGTYTRTQSNYSYNTVISESQINSELNDIAAELTASLEASGKKAWTGNQNAGSTKITALAVGSALTDSTNLGQVQDGGMQYATGSGTNTIVATMAPAITAYVAGQTFRIKMAAGANTGATTLNLNSVGAKAITKIGTTALAAGDIPASAMFEVAYDGTQFQLINVGQATTALVSDSSPQLGGFLDANGNYIQMQKGGDISSASPTVIDTDGDYFICTGTTGFSAMTVAADRHYFLEFAGALVMTHGAGTLDLPGGANITTAAGDVGEFFSTASNVVTCVNYAKKSGKPIVTNFAGSDIAANAIDSDHYVDGSIDSEHYSAASIDEPHLADNSVDSRAYVDGSIDPEHLADNAVTLAKMASGTDGNIISYDASGDPVAIATGTDGQVLTSAGAGAPPAFEDAGGGAWTLIGTQVASSDASLTQTGLSSTYDTYACIISDLDVTVNASIVYIRLGDSSGIDSGASDYKYRSEYDMSNGAATTLESSNGASQMYAALYVGNAAGNSAHAVFYIGNHSTGYSTIQGRYSCVNNSNWLASGGFAGYRTAVITVDRVQILMSSGNMVSGRFTVYGIKHT